jgi:ribosomal-protein-alanine N-acetyltransferase
MSLIEPSRQVWVDMLRPEHAEAIQQLASDPTVAATTRLPHPYPPGGAIEFIERCAKERAESESYVHAIMEDRRLVGVCGLHQVMPRQSAELGFWIGRPFWARGFATFAVGNMLGLAFGPLRLERVFARALETNRASRRVLEKNGFHFVRTEAHQFPDWNPTELLAVYEVTGAQYHASKHAPFLRDLCADLKPILEAELAAGNEIRECSRGWPEKESVIIGFRKPFRPPTGPLPPNVEYREINDTHWWKAEYAAKKPVHLLTCGF